MKVRSLVLLLFASLSALIFLTTVECSSDCCQPKSTTIQLTNYKNYVYYGTFYAGTPRHKFTALFSTRSSDTWLLSCDCTTFSCLQRRRFDSDDSSSYDNQGDLFVIDYGDGTNVTGVTAKEDFKLNDVRICGQGFGLIEEQHGDWSLDKYDAIIGFGLTSYAKNSFIPFFETAFRQGQIDKSLFSFWFNRKIGDPNGGELVLGGINKNRIEGNITYTPLTNSSRWQIKLDKVVVKLENKKKITCDISSQATVQAGYAYIYGPYDEVKRINKALGGKYNSKTGFYHFDCSAQDNLPDIVFYIQGVKFPIKSSAYILQGQDCGHKFGGCFSGIVGVANSNIWELGSVFLGEYYSIFDYGRKRVGFAKLNC